MKFVRCARYVAFGVFSLSIWNLSSVAMAGDPLSTPEIALSSMAGAIALVSGGVAILTDRFRRK